MIGETLGGYRITRKIGEGGMGVVYEAEHLFLGRRAAIKCLLPELSTDAEACGRFFLEATAAAMTNHPSLVAIYDRGHTEQGNAYIIMEYLDGEDLGTVLRRDKKLGCAMALSITRQVASALGAVHQKGIIHRDLKPDNLFLIKTPGNPALSGVKVLDFGIAKLTGPENKELSVKTRTGSVLGTPSYMSPEQCRGHGQVDTRTDIYSLGCILFEMLTGRPPFEGKGYGEVLAQHIYEPPPSLRSLDPTIPEPVDQLMGRLLAKQPDQRMPTMEELAGQIDMLFMHIPQLGGPAPGMYDSGGVIVSQGHANPATTAPMSAAAPPPPGVTPPRQNTPLPQPRAMTPPPGVMPPRQNTPLPQPRAMTPLPGVMPPPRAMTPPPGVMPPPRAMTPPPGVMPPPRAMTPPPGAMPPPPEPPRQTTLGHTASEIVPKPRKAGKKKLMPIAIGVGAIATIVVIAAVAGGGSGGGAGRVATNPEFGATPLEKPAAPASDKPSAAPAADHSAPVAHAEPTPAPTHKPAAAETAAAHEATPPATPEAKPAEGKPAEAAAPSPVATTKPSPAEPQQPAATTPEAKKPVPVAGAAVATVPPPPAQPAKVHVKIESEPPGAEVWRADGKRAGKTPFEQELAPKTAKLSYVVKMKGYKDGRAELPGDKGGTAVVKLIEEPKMVSTPPAPTYHKRRTGKNKKVNDGVVNPFAH